MTPRMLIVLLRVLTFIESTDGQFVYNEETGATGPLQVTPICLRAVNEHYGTSYIMQDMYKVASSRHVATLYWRMWDCESYEDCAKTWYGGPQWASKEGAVEARINAYWAKVRVRIPDEERAYDERERIRKWQAEWMALCIRDYNRLQASRRASKWQVQ